MCIVVNITRTVYYQALKSYVLLYYLCPVYIYIYIYIYKSEYVCVCLSVGLYVCSRLIYKKKANVCVSVCMYVCSRLTL
jgi:hypothetical protein